jgi:hypothetical protein
VFSEPVYSQYPDHTEREKSMMTRGGGAENVNQLVYTYRVLMAKLGNSPSGRKGRS